jgi:hypothetical protein
MAIEHPAVLADGDHPEKLAVKYLAQIAAVSP